MGKARIFFDIFLQPVGDPDQSQNLMGPDHLLIFFHEDLTSSICVIPLTNIQTNQ